jgi:DNA-directed RNA polymerase subunit RPC12/RpoP
VKFPLNQLFVVLYQSSILDQPVIHDDEVHTTEVDAQLECQKLNEDLGVKRRYTYMSLSRYMQQATEVVNDDPIPCPTCIGSRVLGEIRGVPCSNCGGRGLIDK